MKTKTLPQAEGERQGFARTGRRRIFSRLEENPEQMPLVVSGPHEGSWETARNIFGHQLVEKVLSSEQVWRY